MQNIYQTYTSVCLHGVGPTHQECAAQGGSVCPSITTLADPASKQCLTALTGPPCGIENEALQHCRKLAKLRLSIIMYIYHVLINTLSSRMIHINLNMIVYTHVEHSPTKTIYIKYYMEKHTRTTHALHTHTHARTYAHTHTHTHNDCIRNWVLILVGMKIL